MKHDVKAIIRGEKILCPKHFKELEHDLSGWWCADCAEEEVIQ